MAVDVRLLREMVRESERLIDHQLQAMEQLDDKAEHMVGLSVALLAGGVALVGFMIQNLPDRIGFWFALGVSCGVILNLGSIASFLRSYVGIAPHTELHVTPHPTWMLEKVHDEQWSLWRHLGSLVRSYAKYSDVNVAKMRASGIYRAHGTALLALATTFYSTSMFLILGRVILS